MSVRHRISTSGARDDAITIHIERYTSSTVADGSHCEAIGRIDIKLVKDEAIDGTEILDTAQITLRGEAERPVNDPTFTVVTS